MEGLPSTDGRLAGGWIASNTSLKSASPPHIRSRANRWKFVLVSFVGRNSSSASDELPVAIATLILGGTEEKSNRKCNVKLGREEWVGSFPGIFNVAS